MMINGDKIIEGAAQSQANTVVLCGDITAATTADVGAVLKLENTFGVDLLITDMVLNITKASTGAATIDIGVDDGGDVSSDNLIDGANAKTVKPACNTVEGGTNGGMAIWKKGEFIVASASATIAGATGTYAVIARPLV